MTVVSVTGEWSAKEGRNRNFAVSSLLDTQENSENTPVFLTLSDSSVSQRRAVILVASFDSGDVIDCTVDDITQMMWEGTADSTAYFDGWSISEQFAKFTYGQVVFSPHVYNFTDFDIFGPYVIPLGVSSTCNYDQWATSLKDAATLSGVDFRYYQHYIYVLPDTEVCDWLGLGSVGCSYFCSVWSLRCSDMQVISHELGHNMGLRHSASNFDEKGDIITYGDPTSVMGNKWLDTNTIMGFVSCDLDRQGWAPGRFLLVSSSGEYKISSLNEEFANKSYPLAIKIQGSGYTYYFSYSSSKGVGVAEFADQLLVHRLATGSSTPEFITSRNLGTYFFDMYKRFSVAPMQLNDEFMLLQVSLGCDRKPPLYTSFLIGEAGDLVLEEGVFSSISYDGTTQLLMNTGEATSLRISVKSIDSILCPVTSLAISSTCDYNTTVDVQLFSLLPGTECNITVSVTPPSQPLFALSPLTVLVKPDYANDTEFFLEYLVNTTFGSCVQSPRLSFLQLSPFSMNMSQINFTITVANRDLPPCGSSQFFLSISDSRISWVSYPSMKLIQPNAEGNFLLQISSNVEHPNFNVSVTVSSLSASFHNASLLLPLQQDSMCIYKAPVIIYDNEIHNISAHESWFLPFTIISQDAPSCNPRQYMIVSPPSRDGVSMGLLNSTITLCPSQSYQTGATLSTSDLTPDINITFIISVLPVGDVNVDSSEVVLLFRVYTPSCSPYPPYFSFSCPRTFANNTNSLEFTCSSLIINRDSWNCPNRMYYLSPVIVPKGLSATWSVDTWNSYPRYYSRPTLTVKIVANFSGEITIAVKVYDNSGLLSHNVTTSTKVKVGKCVCGNPLLNFVSPIITAGAISSTLWNSLRITDTSAQYCGSYQYTIETNYPGSISVSVAQQVTIQAGGQVTTSIRVESDRSTTGNISVIVRNSKYDECFNTVALTCNFIDTCTLNSPTLLGGTVPQLNPWKGATTEITTTVTNNDLSLCSPTTFSFAITIFNTTTVLLEASVEPSSMTLNPGETGDIKISVVSQNNTGPTSAVLGLSVTDGINRVHGSYMNFPAVVACPPPAPPSNIAVKQFTHNNAVNVLLSWDACTVGLLTCCCPCSFIVLRNGFVLGESETLNFTDTSNITDSETYQYSVITRDSLGRASTNDTCINSVVIHGTKPNKTTSHVLTIVLCTVIPAVVLAAGVAITLCVVKRKQIHSHLQSLFSSIHPSIELKEFFEDEPIPPKNAP
ncbi:carbonate dehydratase [Pelomyxa schiedti]|nr:carbonate dehydratase [Pelomyxa schiedti]